MSATFIVIGLNLPFNLQLFCYCIFFSVHLFLNQLCLDRGDKAAILSNLIKKTNAVEMKWILMIILKGTLLSSIWHVLLSLTEGSDFILFILL